MVSNGNGFNSEIRRPNVVSFASARERLRKCFPRKIDRNSCKEWISNPINLALSVWTACVTISCAILLMLMVGMLNPALPKKSERDAWSEVNNQILNALFTLMCMYQHPIIIRHTVLLLRWRPSDDVGKLRKIYCKNGACKPHERTHMMIVVVLLHLSFIAQYVSCGLYLGYSRSNRPSAGVGICMGATIVVPAVAGAYALFSPLGRDYETTNIDSNESHDVEIAEYIYWVAKSRASKGNFPCQIPIHY